MNITKQQKTILVVGLIGIVAYFMYQNSKTKKGFESTTKRKRRNLTGGNNFFSSHSQNCSGLNCI